jgi:hypothetical protein
MESVSLPLQNRYGDVIGHTLIDAKDFEKVSKLKWHMHTNKVSKKLYVASKIGGKNVMLHHFVFRRPDDNMVIDHINGDGLDNRLGNLRHVTKKQNSQNKNTIIRQRTSRYIGVCKVKNSHKFVASCGKHKLGRYEDEREAGMRYDVCAYLIYGEGAKTNNLISYDKAKANYKLEDIICKPKERLHKDLPAGMYIKQTPKGDKYYAQIHSRKHSIRLRSVYHDCKEDALKMLNEFRQKVCELDKSCLDEHYKQDIPTNNEGLAVICLKSEKHVIVDKDIWHDLSLKKWWMNAHGYVIGTVDGVETPMHTYLYKTFVADIPPNYIIDHINNIRHDNRLSNLRVNTLSGNAHNAKKTKNASSKYYGVYWNKRSNRWFAAITYKYKHYHIGIFKDEIDAAKAYNVRAVELYGEFANVNSFPGALS